MWIHKVLQACGYKYSEKIRYSSGTVVDQLDATASLIPDHTHSLSCHVPFAYLNNSLSSFLLVYYLRQLLMHIENSKTQDRGKDYFTHTHHQAAPSVILYSEHADNLITVLFLVHSGKSGFTSVYKKLFLVQHNKNTVGFRKCLLRI